MGWLALVLGCGADPETAETGGRSCVLTADRAEVAFGDIDLPGLSEAPSQTLTLQNAGDAECLLEFAEIEGPGPFSVDAVGAQRIAAGESAELLLRYLATEDGQDSAELRLVSNDWANPELRVPLSATGRAPVFEWVEQGTFSEALLDCPLTATFTWANQGSLDLQVTDIEVQGAVTRFSVDPDPTGENGPFPWSVAPGETRSVAVTFVSPNALTSQATLVLTTPDLVGGVVSKGLSAAADYAIQTDRILQQDPMQIDLVVSLSGDAGMEAVYSNLDAFLGGLEVGLAAEVDYRVAFVVADDGCVLGETLWLEPGMSSVERAAVLDAQLCGGDPASCAQVDSLRDAQLELLAQALSPENLQTGGCNAGLVRDGALLELLGVSLQADSSPQSAQAYADRFVAVKGDPERVRLSGLGGELPSGCEGAAAYTGVAEVAALTGGRIHSICTPWLSEPAGDLAEQAAAPYAAFPMRQTPATERLAVTVAGDLAFPSAYTVVDNAVVFELSDLPRTGAAVELIYEVLGECERD